MSKPLAFAELHPYNPLTGIMFAVLFRRTAWKFRTTVSGHSSNHRSNRREIVSSFALYCFRFYCCKQYAFSSVVQACIMQARMARARRQSLCGIGLDVDSSFPEELRSYRK